jgi:hypothetical protein
MVQGGRHQTMLMGENVAKMKFRDVDGGAQMKGGATKGNGVFSMPLYEDPVLNKISKTNDKSESPRKGRHQTMLMGENVAKYTPRKLEGGRGIMGGAVQNTVFSTPAYEEKPTDGKEKGKKERHQTVLVAETIAKYQPRTMDEKTPQMMSGGAKGVFSIPAYNDPPPNNEKDGRRLDTHLIAIKGHA